MNNGKQGRPIIYESSFKIALAREYLTSNLGYKTLAKKYGLEKHHTLIHFVKWYKKNYTDAGEPIQQQAQAVVAAKPRSGDDKQLTKQLKEADLKIAGLEMLIENAQKELGIDIVKKSGTKQSHK